MGRNPCSAKEGMNRGAWTAIEDKILIDFIKEKGEGKWRNISKQSGLNRCGKSCRLRWLNYLRPDIKRGNISRDEEDLIVRLHKLLGNRWSLIAGRLPGRTDNEIKNYWNTNLSKKTPKRQANKAEDHEKKSVSIRPPPRNINFPRASQCKDTAKFVDSKWGTRDLSDITMTTTQQQGMGSTLGTNSDHTNVTKIVPSVDPIMQVMDYSQDSSLLGLIKSDSFSDFSIDFDMGEICLSDILSLNDNGPTMFLDEMAYVPEKTADNLRENDQYGRVDEDTDFRALASFFESPEEWLP